MTSIQSKTKAGYPQEETQTAKEPLHRDPFFGPSGATADEDLGVEALVGVHLAVVHGPLQLVDDLPSAQSWMALKSRCHRLKLYERETWF